MLSDCGQVCLMESLTWTLAGARQQGVSNDIDLATAKDGQGLISSLESPSKTAFNRVFPRRDLLQKACLLLLSSQTLQPVQHYLFDKLSLFLSTCA